MYNKQKYLLLNKLSQDGVLKPLEECHAVIAGGAIRSIFAGEFISDYDIYFKSTEYLNEFLSKISETKFEKTFTTEVAKTYKKDNTRIQVILMPELICNNPNLIIEQFDYSVCMGAFDFDTESFFLHNDFLEHLARRELYYNINGKYPLASLFRLKKYLKKGYTISGSEIIKLGLRINNLKMETYVDLKKQLQGIDTLFLAELTDKLMSPEYAEKKYDFNEFLNLIDEHFQEKLDDVLE